MNRETKHSAYGYSMQSPIHVSGFHEERVYIENLRVEGFDQAPDIRRIGSNLSAETGHPIDVYEVKSGPFGIKTDQLFIDLYGASDWRAPEGYQLLCDRPAREGGEPERELGDELQEMIKRILK